MFQSKKKRVILTISASLSRTNISYDRFWNESFWQILYINRVKSHKREKVQILKFVYETFAVCTALITIVSLPCVFSRGSILLLDAKKVNNQILMHLRHKNKFGLRLNAIKVLLEISNEWLLLRDCVYFDKLQ